MNFIYLERPPWMRAHTNRVSNLLLCAWVRVRLSVHGDARNPHSRTADCDVAIIPRVCIDGLLFFTHELRYFSRSSDAFCDSLRFHTRQLSGIVIARKCREKLNNWRLNLHFFSPLGYFITVKCNILFIAILAYSTYNRTSASLSRQKKSLCRTFRILLLSITRSKLRTIAII